MSEHVQHVIAELAEKRDRLIATIESLEWFKREFPHTAASMTLKEPAARPKKAKAGKRDGTGRDGTGANLAPARAAEPP